MSRTVAFLVFVIFSWVTSVWTSPVLQQQVCCRLDDPRAKNLSRIYSHPNKLVWDRSSNDELLSCSSDPGPVELDECSPCVAEELLIVKCHLTDPSAKLDFEGEGMTVPFKHTRISCDSITAWDPPTTTAPAHYTTNLSGGHIAVIIFAVVFVFAAVAVAAVVLVKKKEIGTWWKRCSYQPGQVEDQENVANGPLPGQRGDHRAEGLGSRQVSSSVAALKYPSL